MKITSSTSTTSTSGVMLMSASELRVWPLLLVNATFSLPRHLGSGAFGGGCGAAVRTGISSSEFSSSRQKSSVAEAKILIRADKLVVRHHRRHRHKQSRRRRNQRLGDARRNRPQRRPIPPCPARETHPRRPSPSRTAPQTGWSRQSSPATSSAAPGWSRPRSPPSAPSAPAAVMFRGGPEPPVCRL